MSKLGLVIVMMLMAGSSMAQNYSVSGNGPATYFVLIQSDGGQPFFVRLNSQLYSSSPDGHLILSRLKDSTYSVTVVFPGQVDAGHRFLVDVHQNDLSLHLALRDGRWGLYNSQGRALHEFIDSKATEPPLPGIKKDDPFSQMMSAIVGDTAVMYSTYADASRDSTPIASASLPVDTGNGAVPSAPTGVIKLSEHRSLQSLNLVYADKPVDKTADTIDVLIPIDSQTTSRSVASLVADSSATSDASDLANAGQKTSLPFVNSDCHAFATEYDVDKLRARLRNTPKEGERLLAALKMFKTKCFTTRQVRALTELFKTDASKFKFLSTAYPFVSDNHFKSLVNVLSDPGYIGKFRVLTGQR